MKTTKVIMTTLLLGCNLLCAQQPQPQPDGKGQPQDKGGQAMPTAPGQKKEGQRVYKLIVEEGENKEEFNRSVEEGRSSRSVLMDVVTLYRQALVSKSAAATNDWIELGFNSVVEATTSKRKQWQSAVSNECTFTRTLPMQQEILDFYKEPSQYGPLDPSNMLFSGFGCRQYIQFPDSTLKEVFYISCKLRTDTIGQLRIINHSKFEIEVDSLMFNPFVCDLPNDSLGTETDTRIPFSFANRKDLRFELRATISSSWMTQAMQVFQDQELGEFNISVVIDSSQVHSEVFTYSKRNPADAAKQVSVVGDCFLVPRSYIGSFDEGRIDSWGTGQYKVEMQISESCKINEAYYRDGKDWDRDKWRPEWKNIKRRKHTQNLWSQMLNAASVEYIGSNWVSTWIEPTKTAVLQYDNDFFDRLNDGATTSTGTATGANAATGGATSATGSMPNSPMMPQ
jgi:hypothetical protein